MFGPFGEYVIPWYGRELARIEKIEPQNETQRIALLTRVEDLRVEIEDLADEGFHALSAEFDKQHRAGDRLGRLYNNLYKAGDESLLHPLPRADRLVPHSSQNAGGYGAPQPLSCYLGRLESLGIDDVRDDVRSAPEFEAWRNGVTQILKKQLAFACSVIGRDRATMVALLRDMLPQYLIARWQGLRACALPLGRSYLDRFGPEFEAYDHITGPLYEALAKEPDDFTRMWKRAVAGMRERIIEVPCMRDLAAALRNETQTVLPKGPLLVVETGLQATMPLLFEGVFGENIRWYMFTAAPWLLDIYRERLFCHQYAMLRPCETLACTESIFNVVFENGAWFAQETLDSLTKNLAYWEIATLKSLSASGT